MNLLEQISILEKRKAEIEADYAADDARLQALLAEGKELAKVVDAKKEKAQHLSYAISNLNALYELELPPEVDPQANADPWG